MRPTAYTRVLLFLFLPPIYLYIWTVCWFDPCIWIPGWRQLAEVRLLHQLQVKAQWKKGLGILVISAMDAGANVNEIRAAILPYSQPEEPKFSFTCEITARCHCGGQVEIGRGTGDNLPRNDDGSPAHIALHSAPHCKEFERLDLLSYMRWLRGATES